MTTVYLIKGKFNARDLEKDVMAVLCVFHCLKSIVCSVKFTFKDGFTVIFNKQPLVGM